VSLNIS